MGVRRRASIQLASTDLRGARLLSFKIIMLQMRAVPVWRVRDSLIESGAILVPVALVPSGDSRLLVTIQL